MTKRRQIRKRRFHFLETLRKKYKMPRKRNNAYFRSKKEKQMLTARLIEISLKVDDYIYKHKPISERDAEQYIKEVVSYKTQCARDERSLQVIEKLARCMKAIIAEDQELKGNICNSNDTGFLQNNDIRSRSISPVYSVCEEDTQFTQIALNRANSVNKSQKEAIEIVELCDIDDVDDVLHDTTTKVSSSRINVEVDIHRAISNLSIIEVEDPLEITESDDFFSQSILNNFEGVEKLRRNNINTNSEGAVTCRLLSTDDHKVQTTNAFKTDRKLVNITNINNQYGKIQTEMPNLTIEPVKTQSITSNVQNAVVQNRGPINIIKATNYYVTNASNQIDKTKTSNTLYPVTNKITETQFPDKVCTVNDSSNVLKNVAAIDNENSTKNKKKRAPRKKKTEVDKDAKPKNKRSYQTPKRLNENSNRTNLVKIHKNVPIYNTNVENDLSWLENIRYVREIRVDEKDTKLNLEESFWDNYYLPANWNDSEFT